MKSISENFFTRGKAKTFYLRRRIPADLLVAFPHGQKEIVRSLRTCDKAEAVRRFRLEQVRIDADFAQRVQRQKEQQARSQIRHLESVTDEHIQGLAQYWVRSVVQTDQAARSKGMDDDEFDERGQTIAAQRAELGRMLAQGKVSRILPAMHGFMHLCGLSATMTPAEEQKAGYTFLQAVVAGLDHVGARHAGNSVDTDTVAPVVAHPSTIGLAPCAGPGWETVFETWKNYTEDRPIGTIIANRTPWNQLKVFAAERNLTEPSQLTPQHLSEFVAQMKKAGRSVKTINGRLGKLREIFRVAVGNQVLPSNPAEKTLGFKTAAAKKGIKLRSPFTVDELNRIFGSPVFTQHVRSSGQASEASYWIPLIMFYTGARPEEIAGLQLSDIHNDPTVGWFFRITDLPDKEDSVMFKHDKQSNNDNPENPQEKRRLKNHVSRRNIPVAQQLLDLGLLRYVEWVRQQHATALFPTLRQDYHQKLSGAFSKWFGRYKTELGFASQNKVLYSLRHNMKDFLEAVEVPTKYLKRILGHASGDGSITDGYGSDVPLENVHKYFISINFPAIPAKPWQPGIGCRQIKNRNKAT